MSERDIEESRGRLRVRGLPADADRMRQATLAIQRRLQASASVRARGLTSADVGSEARAAPAEVPASELAFSEA